ncbi:MAG: diguanylate cyclase [Solobacterium sp.]|nr:diguanylate cyclase [Solobacterium sp.]
MKKLWAILSRSIYVGDRLKENMTALTLVSAATAVLGLILIVIDILNRDYKMLLMAFLTLVAGTACAYFAHVKKNREHAIMIPTVFCIVMFTYYALTGAGEGSAIMWVLLLPIGMCYFVSVKYGIILSAYYSILFGILFYGPFRSQIDMYYTPVFMDRFPLLFASLSVFTGMAMVQYHRTALFEIDYQDRLKKEVQEQTAVAEERAHKIEQISFQTIQALANAIDAKDPYTKGHSTRVSRYSEKLAEALGWDSARISDLRCAALLHDIGKSGVPDSILNNPRKLTDVEYGIIKSHTTMGGDILKNRLMIRAAEDVARSHHERYDGRGYPQGLKGEEISEEARIAAIADAFDAMSSNRIYRRSCNLDYIRTELIAGKGKQFDPDYADVFLKLWDEGALDEIIGDTGEENYGEIEVSSVLLKEVMDEFAAKSREEETDPVTGLPNRSAGEVAIAKAMHKDDGCLANLHLDGTEAVREKYGEEEADRLLSITGALLRQSGEQNSACRYGQREFLLFLNKVNEKEAEEAIRRLLDGFRTKINEDPKLNEALLLAGLAMSKTDDVYSAVFSRSDKALYHVRQEGGREFCFYNPESESSSDRVDLNRLLDGIHSAGTYDGAMDVEYRQFAKLFEYISNMERRFDQPFQLIMISLEVTGDNTASPESLETAMFYMEQSIRQTIRNVDILTRYGQNRFLVILMGADAVNVQSVSDRIFRGYYKMSGSGAYSPSWTAVKPQEQ